MRARRKVEEKLEEGEDSEVELAKKDETKRKAKAKDNKQKIISLEMSTHYITRDETQARL